jgi:hypothetical protein
LTPPRVEESAERRDNLPNGYWKRKGFNADRQNFMLLSRYEEARGRFTVQIVRLSDGVVLKTYTPDINAINARSRLRTPLLDLARDKGSSRYVMRHPYLTSDGGIIFNDSSPLVAIDACSRVKWTTDALIHHSLEPGQNGHFWAPQTLVKPTRQRVGKFFVEDALAEISSNGKILRSISVDGILKRNGLSYLVDGRPYTDDPYHLNDIEPVLQDTDHWKAGDLFLSFRHLSTIMLYRPSTDRIVWWRQGPWRMQHDVSILDGERISIFDNAVVSGSEGEVVDGHNRIIFYDFKTDKILAPFDAAMKANDIRTITEGRALIRPDGDAVIEESNFGRVVRISADGTVQWRYITAKRDGTRTFLGWSRFLDGDRFGAAVRQAVGAKCR